ncbi:MCP four helix bundle domain-containing protein, partial [Fundidesulfovibrio magnetotacticus]|uniref:MCP four helix bundle domain-containing protein n=1 Tax=Fundidesulfovibrio magnetotacticus TaxID=2730080 RepID=UPI0015643CB8
MNNLRLAWKIGLGFGLVLLILGILGLLATSRMESAQENSTRMKDEYLPEVALAARLERHVQQTLSAMRGYSYSAKPEYHAEALAELAQVEKALAEARELGDRYPRLVKLREGIAKAQERHAEYVQMATDTKARIDLQAKDRAERVRLAGEVLAQSASFLKSQDSSLRAEIGRDAANEAIVERYEKIALMGVIVQTVADIRIKILSGDSQDDVSQYVAALSLFPELEGNLDKIRGSTHQQANLGRLDMLEDRVIKFKLLVGKQIENTRALAALGEKRAQAARHLLDVAQAVAAAGMEQTSHLAEASDAGLETSGRLLLGGLAVALALGATVAVLITRAITGPVRRGVDFARTVAGGD